ncbi:MULTISPECIES: dihydroneopterin aldolase [Novosphingobium]|uniref:Dihydroneopterin aldolase n=1 Tax=Novosphingobium mangrovi (ex Hu et al. 2023) TaxID=2930094 RepID=A0ABT0ACY0_9SPHN|nr:MULTISPECIES: dihydroneopterin aldolase [Novosphingobium]MCJ1961058.1 dihydroneopterin aldolase [Novosphingobium mangrovi (ex Hu et al. 2023)]
MNQIAPQGFTGVTTHALTTVRVRDLELLADIGINPDEVGRRQPLVLTVELELTGTGITAIDETVDYRRVVAAAEALALVHIPLIETFGQRLAEECLGWPCVQQARVSIDKPFALTRGMAGVEVIMTRPVRFPGPNGEETRP